MPTWRRWLVRGLMAACVGLPLLAVLLYALNPFGADSPDPRQRIVGHAPYRIPSSSMAPTFEPGDIVVMRAGDRHRRTPQRGDVVIFRSPEDGNPWIQRIVGLPGERIAIEDGVVLADGRPLDEPHVRRARATTPYSRYLPELAVPDGHYLLLGDNRDNSLDGRRTGVIEEDRLMGRVVGALRRPGPRSEAGQDAVRR